MVLVHHTSHAIESEPVKLIFVHVKSQVGEQESQDFVVTIVEQTSVWEGSEVSVRQSFLGCA